MTLGVAEIVAKLVRDMDPNPYTQRAPTVRDIVETVRMAYGNDEARTVRITVH
jgi:hypothetical protein